MAKVTAPLLSFGASGSIAKTQVYASWRGIGYARRHVVPANPRTAGQLQTRNVFSFVNGFFKLLNAAAVLPWQAYAKGRPFTGRNAFFKQNILSLNGATGSPDTDLSGMVGSPGAGGGAPPVSITLTDAGSHIIGVAMVDPSLPAGWSITRGQAIAIKQQDPHSPTTYNSEYAEDATSTYAPQIATGAAGTYQVAAWFEYMKPDGTLAYGPSLTAAVVIA